jgi:hypothetical protein
MQNLNENAINVNGLVLKLTASASVVGWGVDV